MQALAIVTPLIPKNIVALQDGMGRKPPLGNL